MNNYLRIIVCVVVWCCLISSVYSVKCWSCKSITDPKCADAFENTTITISDCSKEKSYSGMVLTMCAKILLKGFGEQHYIRKCASPDEAVIQGDELFREINRFGSNIANEHYTIEYFTCNDRDGCNSATLPSPIHLLFVLSVAFSFKII